MTISLNKNVEIHEISSEETFVIRQKVLRPGKPVIQCCFEGDQALDTFHLGAFFQDKLIGVASFMKNSNPLFSPHNQYQLRGMAILESFKKQGIGAQLLKTGESKICSILEEPTLWFNARTTAVGFYEKFDYQIKGEEFEIPEVCKHIVMFKKL